MTVFIPYFPIFVSPKATARQVKKCRASTESKLYYFLKTIQVGRETKTSQQGEMCVLSTFFRVRPTKRGRKNL